MPEWVAIVLLGMIEGLTEFIPVSSTGHLLVAEKWLRVEYDLPPQSDLFNVLVQCGAVLAVLPLFWPRLRDFAFRWREAATRDYLLKLFVAFAITGVGGLILEKEHFRLPENIFPVAVAMIVGGVLFLVIEWFLRGKALRDSITWPIAIAIGLAQLVAIVFPGTSRSGATILCALLFGLSRPLAAEFSFLVGVPTMLSAGGLKVFKVVMSHHAGTEDWPMIFLATAVAAVISFVAVKWLLRYIQTHTFTGFGWYRIAIGVLLLFWQR
jgi:undecaprenyl-diphosphatase